MELITRTWPSGAFFTRYKMLNFKEIIERRLTEEQKKQVNKVINGINKKGGYAYVAEGKVRIQYCSRSNSTDNVFESLDGETIMVTNFRNTKYITEDEFTTMFMFLIRFWR
jgi:hypothetical protein